MFKLFAQHYYWWFVYAMLSTGNIVFAGAPFVGTSHWDIYSYTANSFDSITSFILAGRFVFGIRIYFREIMMTMKYCSKSIHLIVEVSILAIVGLNLFHRQLCRQFNPNFINIGSAGQDNLFSIGGQLWDFNSVWMSRYRMKEVQPATRIVIKKNPIFNFGRIPLYTLHSFWFSWFRQLTYLPHTIRSHPNSQQNLECRLEKAGCRHAERPQLTSRTKNIKLK